MINNKHMMVVWNVDDLKVSHVYSFEITNFANYLPRIFGGLTFHSVKIYYYLVMELEYIEKVTVKVSMIKNLYIVIQEFPDNLGMTAVTLAADHCSR